MSNGLGLTLIGEDMAGVQTDLTEAVPGTVIAIDQDLYHEADAPFERAGRAGWLHGTGMLASGDYLVCQLVFSLAGDGDDSIVAVGVLPREGDSFGAGVLAVTGGTGQYVSASGSVTVETQNPKRYAF